MHLELNLRNQISCCIFYDVQVWICLAVSLFFILISFYGLAYYMEKLAMRQETVGLFANDHHQNPRFGYILGVLLSQGDLKIFIRIRNLKES